MCLLGHKAFNAWLDNRSSPCEESDIVKEEKQSSEQQTQVENDPSGIDNSCIFI